jgi:hypothetical protein
MATYEDHIEKLEAAENIPNETVEAACDAISFVAALHGLYVAEGVLNEDAPIDCGVLENLVDAYHGELAAAAILMSEDSFKGFPELLRGTARSMEDPSAVVPLVVRKGFERLANRIERTRELKKIAINALKEAEAAKIVEK